MPDDNAPRLSALEKLKAREATLKAQIKAEKARAARSEASLHKRKCQTVGMAVLAYAEDHAEFASTLQGILSAYVKDKAPRKLPGLPPLSEDEKDDPAPAGEPENGTLRTG